MDLNRGIEGLLTISASRLRVFKICQRQYWYKYILHYDDRPDQNNDKNVAALLGLALHKAIQEKYENGSKPTLIFQEYMNNTLEEWETKGYTVNALDYFPRAMKVGKQILNDFDWSAFKPVTNGVEVNFTLAFPNEQNALVNINGLIDLLDIRGYIVDHKSATKAPSQDELDHDIQLIIYFWAYKELYGVFPKKVIWHHLRTSKMLEANISENYEYKIEQLTKDIEALVAATHFPRINLTPNICKDRCSFFELCYGAPKKDIE